MNRVAALFVETGGVYFNLPDVDPWDITLDARLYPGPYPVVSHPPCQLWGRFAKINYKRWGGEHNRPGNDGGCFLSALKAVNQFGGVLEHPADTYAYPAFNIPKPQGIGWNQIGSNTYVCEVWQSAYGHKARKRTWLYYVGERPVELKWNKPRGTHQIGWQDKRGKENNKPTLGKKDAVATPIEFRDTLINLARNSRCLI